MNLEYFVPWISPTQDTALRGAVQAVDTLQPPHSREGLPVQRLCTAQMCIWITPNRWRSPCFSIRYFLPMVGPKMRLNISNYPRQKVQGPACRQITSTQAAFTVTSPLAPRLVPRGQ